MSRVWPSQAFKAVLNGAIAATEAHRDTERARFDAKIKKRKRVTSKLNFGKARQQKREAVLNAAIEAMREASKL